MGANMAETNVTAGIRPAVSGSKPLRTGGTSGLPRVGAIRPASPVGTAHQSFSNALTTLGPTPQTPAPQPALTIEPGSSMLSKELQFLLVETRMQEEQATMPAPSNIGRALQSYGDAQDSIRETFGNFQLSPDTLTGRLGNTAA